MVEWAAVAVYNAKKLNAQVIFGLSCAVLCQVDKMEIICKRDEVSFLVRIVLAGDKKNIVTIIDGHTEKFGSRTLLRALETLFLFFSRISTPF